MEVRAGMVNVPHPCLVLGITDRFRQEFRDAEDDIQWSVELVTEEGQKRVVYIEQAALDLFFPQGLLIVGLKSAGYHFPEMEMLERLGQIIESPEIQSGDGGLRALVGGQNDNILNPVDLFESLQGFQAGESFHPEIEDDDREILAVGNFDRLFTGGNGGDVVIVPKTKFQSFANQRFVIDDQEFTGLRFSDHVPNDRDEREAG